jgi:IS5 family transposase
MRPFSFSSRDCAARKKTIEHGQFLAEMSAILPWSKPEAPIAPYNPPGLGSQGKPRERFCDVLLTLPFCDLEFRCADVPGETTILNFRGLFERRPLTKAIFSAANTHLEAKGCFCVAA